MKQTVLMMGPLPEAHTKILEERYTVHRLWSAKDPEALLQSIREDVTAIVSTFENGGVSGRMIRALPNLEIISHFAVGYDNIDLEAAKERGVVVTHTPDVLTEDTADIGMGLLLATMRRLVEGDIYARSGQWAKKGLMPPGRSLHGKTMGIVGLGRIGQSVARKAEAFGIKVVYFGRSKKEGFSYQWFDDLEAMAKEVDILMLTCPGGKATHHLINAKILKALGKNGFLVNIARGSVVHEQDLIDALESGVIAGAGLDVFENEPHVPSALTHLDNVVLQPHVGSSTVEARDSMAQLVVDNLSGWFDEAKVLTQVPNTA